MLSDVLVRPLLFPLDHSTPLHSGVLVLVLVLVSLHISTLALMVLFLRRFGFSLQLSFF
jgi:hypothetical protein